MTDSNNTYLSHLMIFAGTIVLAISLHFLTDINIAGIRLRVAISDLFLPAFLPLCVYLNYKYKLFNVLAINRKIVLVLFGATLWIIISLMNGRVIIGSWQTWAVMNKTVGWFVLLGYFIAGYYIGGFGRKNSDLFLGAFLVSAWLIGVLYTVKYIIYWHAMSEDHSLIRMEGFFSNPNAFGIVMAVVAMLSIPVMKQEKLFSQWLHAFGLSIVLICVFLSGSRSAMLGIMFTMPLMIYLKQINVRMIVKITGVTLLILISAYTIPNLVKHYVHTGDGQGYQVKRPYALRDNVLSDIGLQARIDSSLHAIELWKEKPLSGIGLGVFYWDQLKSGKEFPIIIHTTALWVLVEMGVVGACIFLALFLTVIRIFWIDKKINNESPMFIGMLGAMIVILGASVGTEILYQRYIWVLIGVTIALSDQIKRNNNQHQNFVTNE